MRLHPRPLAVVLLAALVGLVAAVVAPATAGAGAPLRSIGGLRYDADRDTPTGGPNGSTVRHLANTERLADDLIKGGRLPDTPEGREQALRFTIAGAYKSCLIERCRWEETGFLDKPAYRQRDYLPPGMALSPAARGPGSNHRELLALLAYAGQVAGGGGAAGGRRGRP